MISSLLWVKKGAAQQVPERYKLTDEEFERVAEKIGAQVNNAKADLQSGDQESMEVEGNETTSGKPSSTKEDAELAEYNLDDYDNDSEPEEEEEGPASIPLFSRVQGLTYHQEDKADPYVTVNDEEDEEEELREMEVLATDNLLLAAKTEDDISHVEIYLYEEAEDNLYVHHDIMLPSFPLCLEWLDYRVGRKADVGTTGNYVAIGTFDPQVEIWDLDVVDAVYPECILGATSETHDIVDGGKKKKKKFGPARVAKSANAERHVDAVLSIAWNPTHRNLIATGSADTTVKLWDLSKPDTALRNFTHHKDKVQAVAWNKAEPTVLLTGGYDKRVCAFDTRAPTAVTEWKLTADVECIKWDPFHSERFYVSTEDGLVQCFDARTSGSAPIFTLHAHDGAVSALDVSPLLDGLLITGSTDKTVKVWNIKDAKPSCLVSRDLNLGKVFAVNFSPDSPYSVATAGSNGKVLVWNLESNAGVRRAFGPAQFNGAPEAESKITRKEVTEVESDGEGEHDDDEEEDEGMQMEAEEDAEDSEEEHV
ncbi:WD40-repeat-containing domain protein [Phlyctochytrium arcticum]|nr:WD40-repeat-containing domain protein [Phlyctochytrium arcticum]